MVFGCMMKRKLCLHGECYSYTPVIINVERGGRHTCIHIHTYNNLKIAATNMVTLLAKAMHVPNLPHRYTRATGMGIK